MAHDFEKHAQKGNKFLNDLATELGNVEDTQRAGRVLRSVLHTLRNYLTLEENFHLLSQMPMALKGLYVDSWAPFKQREKGKTRHDFFQQVLLADGNQALIDYSNREDVKQCTKAVLTVLREYVTEGEFMDIKSVLPKELKSLIPVEKVSA